MVSIIYQNKYLNILEWLSLINLIFLSAIYNPWYGQSYLQQVVTIVSVSVALATCLGIIVYHMLIRSKLISTFENFIAKFRFNDGETQGLLPHEEYNVRHKELEQPTSTEVWLKRETLIF